MNAPANIDARTISLARERSAFFSLSQTQRRFAHEYKRWAKAAEAEGDLERYRRFRAESNRLWNEAIWHLQAAKRRAR